MEHVVYAPAPVAGRGRLPRALRVLLWAAGAIALLLVLLIAAALLLNRYDEPASADAKSMAGIVASARQGAPGDDALAALAALPARDGDRAARGERLHAALEACGMRSKPECNSLLAAAAPDMPAWIERESALLSAYRDALPRRGWYQAPPPATPDGWNMPPLAAGMQAQAVLLVQAYVDARAGRAGAVREALQADAAFWRAALAGARTLPVKMLAARAVSRNLEFGVLALQQLPGASVAATVPDAWRPAISDAERSLLVPLAWEWQFNDNFMRHSHAQAERQRRAGDSLAPPANWLFKPQATSNVNAGQLRRIAQAASAPYPQLRESLRELDREIADRTRFPYSVYNPIGHILSSIAAPAYADYGVRTADIEARRRAVLAVSQLHATRVPPARAAAALDALPHNPYTQRAFEWDADAGCVRVGGIGVDGRGCIPYASAAGR